MSEQSLKKFNHAKISEFIDEIEVPEEFCDQVRNQRTDMRIINFLIQSELYDEAIKFLAFGLPIREAVWWAYVCSEELEKDEKCSNTQNALRAISEWVKKPNDDIRRQTKVFADALDLYTPTSWAAIAVFWSGGSIVSQDKPEVEADKFMSGYAVSNSLIIAAERDKKPAEKKKLYIKRGLHIAMGGNGRIN